MTNNDKNSAPVSWKVITVIVIAGSIVGVAPLISIILSVGVSW